MKRKNINNPLTRGDALVVAADQEFEKYLKSIVPHLPIWAKEGNIAVSRVQDIFVDRKGNQANIEYVYWIDKKGKKHKSVAWVRWE